MNPDLRWTPAGDYTLAIDGTTIRARNAKGKVLKSVPAKVKKTESYRQLETLSTWLEKHERNCGDTVHEWFLRGERVSASLLAALWTDPSWRKYVKDLVVRVLRPEAAGEQITGPLRDADKQALHLVDLDGETISIPASPAAGVQTTVTVPHPVLIADIDDWRGLAAELGVTQDADQLFRKVHVKPGTEQGRRDALTRYSRAHYEKGDLPHSKEQGRRLGGHPLRNKPPGH